METPEDQRVLHYSISSHTFEDEDLRVGIQTLLFNGTLSPTTVLKLEI